KNKNWSPLEITRFLELNLLKVQKPGRYIGGELNQVNKNWADIATKVVLAFPDIYDLGLPNLGLMILYDILNKMDTVLAERVYAPWTDMEKIMRREKVPLFALESKTQLSDFDIVAFTMPYESIYTNILNMLDLSDIHLRSSQRSEDDPIIIAGGHATFNPEPMADFIDAFVLGDGEIIIEEIVTAYETAKVLGKEKIEILKDFAALPGVYVPAFYDVTYQPDGTVNSITPNQPDIPKTIKKHMAPFLPHAPEKPLVPNIDVVHNRVSVEIMRGCTRGCRFCQAGFISRPVRERPISEILKIIETSLDNTGYEEISLLSLSSSDFSQIGELIDAIKDKFKNKNLTISLPSLRIESFSIDLMEKLKNSRPGGFTLAPEAATDRMRNIINKPISEELLLQTAGQIYQHGWSTIKLYFMIGHPSETEEDVLAIASLCKKVLGEGMKVLGKRAKLNVGISTFIPKPLTPFQWVPIDQKNKIVEKQKLLRENLYVKGIKLSLSSPKETIFESLLSRGDRKLCNVIENAWEHGAKFDAWREHFNFEIWQNALSHEQINKDFYTIRQRKTDEHFAWD
ncbi:TIGR03960 family B12-binding radical SAM protein, partial [Desulfobacula sp.]|uniref:TIGR03960 family B12-binding radical SAM protein n=1 Tax=Desulfobacula sp. TaxID=2593537 RepID=UPI0025C14A11